MMKVCFGCLAIALLVQTVAAFAEDTPNPLPPGLFTPQFLKSRTWNKSDLAPSKLVQSWPGYSGDQDFPDKTVVRSALVLVGTTTFRAEYRTYKATGQQELVFIAKDFQRKDCTDLRAWLTNNLGKPSVVGDTEYSADINLSEQWNLKYSRVTFLCSGYDPGSGFVSAVGAIWISSNAIQRPMLPALVLSCTEKSRFRGDEAVRENPSLKLVIDQNYKRMYLGGGGIPGEIDTYTGDNIEEHGVISSENGTDYPFTFRLDRQTGDYTWDTEGDSSGHAAISMESWGHCEKVQADQRI